MQFSPPSLHFIPVRSKYPPQHPVLKHPQSMKMHSLLKYTLICRGFCGRGAEEELVQRKLLSFFEVSLGRQLLGTSWGYITPNTSKYLQIHNWD
jgi:hypothetical protein